uniref:Aquaporin n=1 Tax=Meloidogyne hapla TaxID=6305 RepID=A0A1I8BP56_MELHA
MFVLISNNFYSYINGQHSPRIASLLMITQFAAGVAIIYGSAVEAIGLLCCKMAEHFIDENIINEKFVTIVLSIVSGLITILGINLTGMYANPIVAWALTFNCGEVTHFAHFIVYWFAPLCAFFLSKWLFVDEQEVEESKENEKKEKKVK